MSITVDAETGLKVFDTRAAVASDKIAGRGYSIVEDEALKTLPPPPAGAVFNADELQYLRTNPCSQRANCYTTASHSFISSHYHSTKQPDHARIPRRQDEHPLYISYPSIREVTGSFVEIARTTIFTAAGEMHLTPIELRLFKQNV